MKDGLVSISIETKLGGQGSRALCLRTLVLRSVSERKAMQSSYRCQTRFMAAAAASTVSRCIRGKEPAFASRTRVSQALFWALRSRCCSRQAVLEQTESVDLGTRAAADVQQTFSGLG
jgi:hypothetical protein